MHLDGDARCRAALMHLGLWLFVPTLFIQRMDGAWKLVLAEEKQGDDLSCIIPLLRITNDDLPGDCIIPTSMIPRGGSWGGEEEGRKSGVLRLGRLSVRTVDGRLVATRGAPLFVLTVPFPSVRSQGTLLIHRRRSLSLFNFEVDAARWMRHGATGTVLRSAGGVGVFSRPEFSRPEELRRPHKSALID
ncbi:hypothetical protein EDB89DRAFT_1911987 [Lactarius sanguifluus]|nr:hypothetical protein EDB89DRAFT_1911987 [Lactarius sanguifluus]